jgi:hypothetical protein
MVGVGVKTTDERRDLSQENDQVSERNNGNGSQPPRAALVEVAIRSREAHFLGICRHAARDSIS